MKFNYKLQILLIICLLPLAQLLQVVEKVEPEVKEESSKQEIDNKQLFQLEYNSLKLIIQQSKLVVVYLHEGEINQEIEQILGEAAKEISEYRLAKQLPVALFGTVDSSQDKEILSFLKISYSNEQKHQLILFIQGNQINYEGEYNKEQILSFIKGKIENSIKEIKTEEELKEYMKVNEKKKVLIGSNNSTFIDLLQEKEQNYELFTNMDIQEVRLITDQSLLNQIPELKDSKLPFVCFVKNNQFPEEKHYHFYEGSFDHVEWIKDYVLVESINLVEELNAESYVRVFASSVESQIHLFLDPNVDNSQVIQEFRKAALYNKEEELRYERMVFVIQYYSDETKEFIQLYDVRGVQDLPFIGISTLDYNSFGITKYIYDKQNQMVSENINKFIDDARKKVIEVHLRSEELPTEEQLKQQEQNKIYKLVGQNFKEKVIKDKFSYFILFWDSKDKNSAKQYFDFLKKFVNEIPAIQYEHLLKIATFDLNKNEVQYLNIDQAPKFVVYPQYYKQNPQGYKGPLKIESISKFLNQWVRDLQISVPLPLGGSQKQDL
ncbi:protein disulfide isomerase, putative (macronuclear) [Tetrahymena thermophila SB210]|uniref:protein disulfide-isomerase n=1 Tax=Tetrahymena thermophila (strain SB210) TaxID=312017 RepID=Q22GE1_TETTS|nr:protein disulfide isomerase, putative [Tetrahymena thermophila SB210]EAR84390.2 protein disulfide isomerase, putative [Tetrahymena thermophila SB210]|eukprot:XP_001032053.2 protein disulfide isomerase, putative [Tetrahymena thermophila SB210]